MAGRDCLCSDFQMGIRHKPGPGSVWTETFLQDFWRRCKAPPQESMLRAGVLAVTQEGCPLCLAPGLRPFLSDHPCDTAARTDEEDRNQGVRPRLAVGFGMIDHLSSHEEDTADGAHRTGCRIRHWSIPHCNESHDSREHCLAYACSRMTPRSSFRGPKQVHYQVTSETRGTQRRTEYAHHRGDGASPD